MPPPPSVPEPRLCLRKKKRHFYEVLGWRRCCPWPRRRGYGGPSRVQRSDRPRFLVASDEAFWIERVQSRSGVGLHVRVPRELEVALKPPLREDMVVVLGCACDVRTWRKGGKHTSAVLRNAKGGSGTQIVPSQQRDAARADDINITHRLSGRGCHAIIHALVESGSPSLLGTEGRPGRCQGQTEA